MLLADAFSAWSWTLVFEIAAGVAIALVVLALVRFALSRA